MSTLKKIIIATRASRLALWQAHHVRMQILQHYSSTTVELLEMTTRGDQILDRTLSKVGGKGLFVKELETALLDGRAHLAVHSLKDVPVDLQLPFELSTVMQRADVRDAFVSKQYDNLQQLPHGAIVGTSSLRREAQIRARYPHLIIKPLRGNLDTRLAKLDTGEYAGIILAAAGLQRLGLGERIKSFLSIADSLPAAGQGALGIEILAENSELKAMLNVLSCPDTWSATIAERAVSAALGGSCQVPLAAHAQVDGDVLNLKALVALPDGSKILEISVSGQRAKAAQIGLQAAQELRALGADAVLQQAIAQN